MRTRSSEEQKNYDDERIEKLEILHFPDFNINSIIFFKRRDKNAQLDKFKAALINL